MLGNLNIILHDIKDDINLILSGTVRALQLYKESCRCLQDARNIWSKMTQSQGNSLKPLKTNL